MNVLEIISKGGPVVWVLLGYSVVAFTIVLERYLHFLRMGRLPSTFNLQLMDAMKTNQVASLVSGMRGPEAAVLEGLQQAFQQGIKDLTRVAVRIGSHELQRMERGFRTLGLLGDTAPLLGLFGTITGMIKAFIVIEQAGGKVDAQALAGGIWEAMVTTGIGLAVALPILFLLHWLEGQAARRSSAMQQLASLMIENLPHNSVDTSMDSSHHREEKTYGV